MKIKNMLIVISVIAVLAAVGYVFVRQKPAVSVQDEVAPSPETVAERNQPVFPGVSVTMPTSTPTPTASSTLNATSTASSSRH
jgi:hypothetical protein